MTGTPISAKTTEQYVTEIRANRSERVWTPVPARMIGELLFLAGITQWMDPEIGIDKIMKVTNEIGYLQKSGEMISNPEITIEGPTNVGAYEPESWVAVR